MAVPLPPNTLAPVHPTLSFLRATKLTQEAFFIYRQKLQQNGNIFTFNEDNSECVLGVDDINAPMYANMAADGINIYGPPMIMPFGFDYNEAAIRTVLMIFQCMESTIVMSCMVKRAIAPFCQRIEDVHFQPKNEQLHAYREGERDRPRCTHYVLKATLLDGTEWVVDMTAPQYKWYDDPPAYPWADYLRDRVDHLSFVQGDELLSSFVDDYVEDIICDFTYYGTPLFDDYDERNGNADIRGTYGRWILRRDLEDGVDKFEQRHMPLRTLVALPEDHYQHNTKLFLDWVWDWTSSVPQRWDKIKQDWDLDSPYTNVIRNKRLIQARGYDRYIKPDTNIRYPELEAVMVWLEMHAQNKRFQSLSPGRGPSEPPSLSAQQNQPQPPPPQNQHHHGHWNNPNTFDPFAAPLWNNPNAFDPFAAPFAAGVPANPFPTNGPSTAFTPTALAAHPQVHLPTMASTTGAMLAQATNLNAGKDTEMTDTDSWSNWSNWDGNANASSHYDPERVKAIMSIKNICNPCSPLCRHRSYGPKSDGFECAKVDHGEVQDTEVQDAGVEDADAQDSEVQEGEADDDDEADEEENAAAILLGKGSKGGKTRAKPW